MKYSFLAAAFSSPVKYQCHHVLFLTTYIEPLYESIADDRLLRCNVWAQVSIKERHDVFTASYSWVRWYIRSCSNTKTNNNNRPSILIRFIFIKDIHPGSTVQYVPCDRARKIERSSSHVQNLFSLELFLPSSVRPSIHFIIHHWSLSISFLPSLLSLFLPFTELSFFLRRVIEQLGW